MPTVLLLRHAQSEWNAEGRWQGQADPPLSSQGERQAAEAGARLAGSDLFGSEQAAPDLIVSSDLERARRTAEVVATAAGSTGPHLVEPLLRELHVGAWSGLTRTEIEQRWPGLLASFDRGIHTSPPGGETRLAFDSRVARAMDALARTIDQRGAAQVVVVTHGGVLRAMARLAGWEEVPVGHLSGYVGAVAGERLALTRRLELLPHATRPTARPAL